VTTEQNKITARRVVEDGFNKRDMKILDEVYAKNAITHDPQQQNAGTGPEAVRKSMSTWLVAFPDVKLVIEHEIAEGDLVVQRLKATGTNTGSLTGMPATGKKTSSEGVMTSRFEDGKIVESWTLFDQLGLLQQLGAIPTEPTRLREPVGAAR
jgi:steroid delta-isomerase-like uncharacterized protein